MADKSIGLLHPGEMGAAIGAALVQAGHRVSWASLGRGLQSRRRAEAAGLQDARTLAALTERSEVLIAVCPPHAALGVARELPPFRGLYVDANAIAPATASELANAVEAKGATYIDGSIIGAPPRPDRMTMLYLSGPSAHLARELFEGTTVNATILSDSPVAASALKMCHSGWTKGTTALLLAVRALALATGVEGALLAGWQEAHPGLLELSISAGEQAATKGWRWVGEMEEIASTFRSAGLPAGFHHAAADIYSRPARDRRAMPDARTLSVVLDALLGR